MIRTAVVSRIWFRQYGFLCLSGLIVFGQWFTLMISTHRQTDVWFHLHHRRGQDAAENDLPRNMNTNTNNDDITHHHDNLVSLMNNTRVVKALQANLRALEEELKVRDESVAKEKRALAIRKKQIESQTSSVRQELEAALEQSQMQRARIQELEAELAQVAVPADCTCVNCKEDPNCGGLWKGDAVGGDAHAFDRITLVVSHCLKPLHWIEKFTKGFVVDDVTIISKCNNTVVGAPPNSTIVRLPNVGRCDHSYAHWIHDHVTTQQQQEQQQDEKHVVLFLKDDRDDKHIHQPGVWRNFSEMLRIASQNDFACGMEPINRNKIFTSISAYHETSDLRTFKLNRYESKRKTYDHIAEEAPFASPLYHTMGDWVVDLQLDFPQDLVEVCYGGSFAATTRQFRKKPITMWSNLTQSLSRGGNIVEGHYAERAWGGLLSNPATKRQVEALRKHGTWVVKFPSYIWGALVEENKGKYIYKNEH
eukprot:scaffold278_cov195-Amphora_coffeaeformis.AAC.19